MVRALAVGAVLVGVAALPYKVFELDRFFVPKEVVLQVVAAVALVRAPGQPTGAVAAPDVSPSGAPWRAGAVAALLAWLAAHVDALLLAFLVVSAASAALAPSGWLAARALGVSSAGLALFWAARAAARAGWAPGVLRAAAGLVAVAVVTALLQAYGVRTEYFSLNRAPGGTFGNRNFVAHLCAIGLPLVAYLALRARSARGVLAATAVFGAAAATLVLTRSRAAWLGAAAAALPFAVGLLRAVMARRGAAPARHANSPADSFRARRALLLVAAAGAMALAAVSLPNALDWRSDSPYLDSARGMVNYREGSGQGRLKQWRNSARLLLADPLLGVGPGHWSTRYPAVAPAGDPSLTDERTTANPWPSSDWVAVASERGLLGVGALALAMVALFWRAHILVWRSTSPGQQLVGGTLGAVLAATLVTGAFDAVLLLAAPAFLAWTTLGGLLGASELADSASRNAATLPPRARVRPHALRLAQLALAVLLAAGAAVGAAHGAAMALFSTGRPVAIDRAAVLAPGDYRIVLRAAQLAGQSGRCAEARRWGAAAHTLAPSAPAAARVLRTCGGRRLSAQPPRRRTVSARP